MTEKLNRQSAKIYEFPSGGRAELHGHRLVKKAAAIVPASNRIAKVEFGTGWYHDAAIQEAEMVRWR